MAAPHLGEAYADVSRPHDRGYGRSTNSAWITLIAKDDDKQRWFRLTTQDRLLIQMGTATPTTTGGATFVHNQTNLTGYFTLPAGQNLYFRSAATNTVYCGAEVWETWPILNQRDAFA